MGWICHVCRHIFEATADDERPTAGWSRVETSGAAAVLLGSEVVSDRCRCGWSHQCHRRSCRLASGGVDGSPQLCCQLISTTINSCVPRQSCCRWWSCWIAGGSKSCSSMRLLACFLRSECLHNISSVLYVCALLFIWHGRFEILCFSGSYILGADGGIWTQNRRLCKYFLSVLLRISERRLLY